MKNKTINAVICKKFDEFISSISDSSVKSLIRENSIITGGCIASMLLKEKVNDFDIYFTNKETVLAVSKYYVTKFNSINNTDGVVVDGATVTEFDFVGGAGLNLTPDRVKIIFKSAGVAAEDGVNPDNDEETISYISKALDEAEKEDDKEKYRPIFLSCNAITLSNKIQIIIRFYGEPDEIHENYDYAHCTNYWVSKTKTLVLKQASLESLLAKELQYIGSKYPLASIIRARKFMKRGWTINAGQYLKMSYQISELNLNDINVLEDQLVGVDVAYFNMLIDGLRKHIEKCKEEKVDFQIDYSYLATIIDRIF